MNIPIAYAVNDAARATRASRAARNYTLARIARGGESGAGRTTPIRARRRPRFRGTHEPLVVEDACIRQLLGSDVCTRGLASRVLARAAASARPRQRTGLGRRLDRFFRSLALLCDEPALGEEGGLDRAKRARHREVNHRSERQQERPESPTAPAGAMRRRARRRQASGSRYARLSRRRPSRRARWRPTNASGASSERGTPESGSSIASAAPRAMACSAGP